MKNTYTYLEAAQHRRTYYGITSQSPVSDADIEEMVKNAVLHSPSAFNSQSGRVLLLLGRHHARLWGIVMETLRRIAKPEAWAATEKKVGGFAAGYGTALFYEDQTIVQGLQDKYPSYADNFPVWSMQSSGMLQLMLWTLLEEAGFGASLQHYNPLIDAEAANAFGIPSAWRLAAQMPFGAPAAEPDAKTFAPIDERVRVLR